MFLIKYLWVTAKDIYQQLYAIIYCICNIHVSAKLWLTHWGRVTHICIGKLTIIGSDNGLLPGRRQAIIWTIAGILLIGPLGTNFSEILIKIHTFSFKKIHLKMASRKWRPFCLGLDELIVVSTCWENKWVPGSDWLSVFWNRNLCYYGKLVFRYTLLLDEDVTYGDVQTYVHVT